MHKHKIVGEKTWHGVGGEEAEDGLDRGLEGGRLAICRHGKDLDGFSVLADGLEDGYGAIRIILGSALDFHGSQDGGGLIHSIGIGPYMSVMHGPWPIAGGYILTGIGPIYCISERNQDDVALA